VPNIAFLGTPGHVREPGRFDDDTLLRVLGANSGNLIFQHAAARLVDGDRFYISIAETPFSDSRTLRTADLLVFPAANHLRLGADWTRLNDFLERYDRPMIVLGLGAQSPSLGGESETIAALTQDAGVARMAAIFRDRAAFVSVRGPYSQTVCAALGLPDVAVLGCPSAFINPEPGLGRYIAGALDIARARAGAGNPPAYAITAAAPQKLRADAHKLALERRLVGWGMAAGALYIQQSGGVAPMHATDGRWDGLPEPQRQSMRKLLAPDAEVGAFRDFIVGSGRFYLSAEAWIAELAGRGLVIGTRMHGNMAAIAAGIPGIVIAHDSRTGELAETMHLPEVDMQAVMAAPDLASALAAVRFDGAAFDRWRAATAAALVAAFGRAGVTPAAGLRALAGAGA
jgi:hypothetical protein